MTTDSGPEPSTAHSGQRWLKPATWLMAGIAAIWIGYESWRLLFQFTPAGNVALLGAVGAVDLSLRHLEVNAWFAGEPIYRTLGNAVYPPASYLLLWPFVGWLSFPAARILWATLTVFTLIPLVRRFARAGGATSRAERRALTLLPLATYPVGATIGNGQLGIVVMLCLFVALPLLTDRERSWSRDLCIAGLFLLALVKPTLAVPFFWIVLFVPGGLRPAALIGLGYAGLTVLASLAQKHGPVALFAGWFRRGVHGSGWGAEHGEGSIRAVKGTLRITSINLHSVLGYLDRSEWITVASVSVLLLLGLWVWLHRRSSIWLLMGVVALVTRLYIYHGWYDDVLLLLPLIALFREARNRCEGPTRTAVVLFIAMVAFLLAPGGGYLLPYPWNNAYLIAQAALWLVILVFLARATRRRTQVRGAA